MTRTLTFATLFILGSLTLSAQRLPELYPQPHKVELGKKIQALSPAQLHLGKVLDTLTLPQIHAQQELFTKARVQLGLRGEASLRAYASKVPNQAESYYLQFDSKKTILVGADSIGLYYGLQTLRQLLSEERILPSCTITDSPDVALRGVVEGFYGNPYSHRDRIEQFKFYGRTKLNTYIYGPKDDPYHREKWRELYPSEERQRIGQLVSEAHSRGVRFVWAIHPGLDIKWTQADRDAVVRKCEDMYHLGVRSFAVFFDDISADDESAGHQADLMNYLYEHFQKTGMQVSSLILCPTQYNQAWAKGNYLDILGTKMRPKIEIMWTGKTVVTMIDRETMEYVNGRIRRKGYVWLNYPVTDFAVDHLLLGPMKGNATDLAPLLGGFVANPMEYAEASKIAIFSVADYLWNMKAYDADRAWEGVTKELYPQAVEEFRRFAQDNIDPGANGHRFRIPGESRDFVPYISQFKEAYLKTGSVPSTLRLKLSNRFALMGNDALTVMASYHDSPALTEELLPWLQVYYFMSMQGQALLKMQEELEHGNYSSFMKLYDALRDVEVEQSAIRSRDFKGSLNAPYPKPASQVVAPFLSWLKRQLYARYRKAYTYQVDKLPAPLVESGKYYVKVKGAYLTNSSAGIQLITKADTINPQRQVWLIDFDQETGRYVLTNAQDQQVLTSSLKLTKSADKSRDSFTLHRNESGFFALQNAEEALAYIWGLKDGKLHINYRKTPQPEDYLFELLPAE